MISKEEVLKIAKLARLALAEKEIGKMQKDLSSILDYFNLLKKVDTKKVKSKLTFIELEKSVRKDIAMEKPASLANNLVQAAPDKIDGYIKVKQIL